jgi:hypothetical protein
MNGMKISAQAAGFALAVVITWAMKQFANIEAPDPVVVAIGTLCSIGASLVIPDSKEAA